MVATVVIVVQTQRATAEARQGELVKQFVIDAFRASVQGDEADDSGRASSFERLLERNAQLIERAGSPELKAQLYGIVAGLLLDAKSYESAAASARSQLEVLEDARTTPPPEHVPPMLALCRRPCWAATVCRKRLRRRDARSRSPATIRQSSPCARAPADREQPSSRTASSMPPLAAPSTEADDGPA